MKQMLGSGPVYAALGNHDSYNVSVMVSSLKAHILYLYLRAQDAPHAIGGAAADQFSWYVIKKMPIIFIIDFLYRHYDHVAGLWQHEGWLPNAAVEFSRSHYAAYMVKRTDGLRIITLNTDLCKNGILLFYISRKD